MMADIIETDTGNMGKDADRMADLLKLIRQDMNGMYEAVNGLNSTWSGPDHTLFVQQFTKDRKSFEKLCDGIEDMIDSMKSAKKSYEKCEQAVAQEIYHIRR